MQTTNNKINKKNIPQIKTKIGILFNAGFNIIPSPNERRHKKIQNTRKLSNISR